MNATVQVAFADNAEDQSEIYKNAVTDGYDSTVDAVAIFNAVRAGRCPGFKVHTERYSDSDILCEITGRSIKPIAVLYNGKVSPMPPVMDSQGEEGEHRAWALHYKLRKIGRQIQDPEATPA